MAAPSTAISRWDLSMSYTEFSLLANRMKFIGTKILPPVFVQKADASFRRINIESLLTKVEDTARQPKSTYKRDFFEWSQDSYRTQEHGVEEVVDDAEIEMYGSEIRAEVINAQRAVNRVLQAYESTVASAVFNTSTWTGAALTTTVGTPWSTKASADPIADVDAARVKVEDGCGFSPNTLIVTDKGFRAMKRATRVEDLLKYSGIDDPKNVTPAMLAEIMELDQIIIAKGGFQNTADLGQTASLSRFWDTTMAMLCYITLNPTPTLEDPEPTLGRTIQFAQQAPMPGAEDESVGVIMEEYREENRRGGIMRARTNYQVKIIHPEAGHLLQGVTA